MLLENTFVVALDLLKLNVFFLQSKFQHPKILKQTFLMLLY